MDIYCVDAFTKERFSGNPAAVCLADGDLDENLMQSIAAEMNLSETAFVRRSGHETGLRWFTPMTEMDLCGHATLAAAHVLFETGAAEKRVVFSTKSGELAVQRTRTGLEMDFPALETEPVAVPEGLLEALGVEPTFVGLSRSDLLVELATEADVRALHPDRQRVLGLAALGVIVTARGDEATPADFVSRFFTPARGIEEDPVTGSAHCALGPYWAARLGRDDLVGYQASRRGGTVAVSLRGDRVALGGEAVIVTRGTIE